MGKCWEHDKLSYWTRRQAKNAARRHHGEHKSVYFCELTNCYHIGELSQDVIKGKKGRGEIYR